MGAAAHYEMRWKRPAVTAATYRDVIAESNGRAAPFFFHDRHPDVARRVIASWSWVPYEVHCNLIRLQHPDLRAMIAAIDVPTLVVAGADDRSTPVERAEEIVSLVPSSTLHVVADSGHFMFMEHPAEVAGVIREFLISSAPI
jgi:pimeloyl-ACP methyl ester carboxylesterase